MKIDPRSIPQEVISVTKPLKKAGFEAYLVGGCVRDLLRGVSPKDWDIATNATPEEMIKLFEHTYYENSFGTVGVVNEETQDGNLRVVEVTPYRKEGVYSDRRRPDEVVFGKDVKEDLKRRDFTINAIAVESETLETIDPHSGQKDLKSQLIRAVGDPEQRFEEDGLRILRAIRFQAELGFTIEESTLNAIHKKRDTLSYISKERIRDEFSRMINSRNPAASLEMARRLELLQYIIPELEEGVGIEQKGAHRYDVFTHSLQALQHAADRGWSFEVRLAVLFHDIGKPRSRRENPKRGFSFYGHEVIGAKMTESALKRLNFPKDTVRNVSLLVRWHMFLSDPDKISLTAIRRLLQNVGEELIWDLIKVRFSDRMGMGLPKEEPYRLRKFQAMIEEVLSDPISVKALAVNGKDIMANTKTEPGPRVGFILHALLEEVIENPSLNSKDLLLKRSEELAELNDRELERRGKSGKSSLEKAEEERLKILMKRYNVS